MRVHVVWHPYFGDGQRYAKRIFEFFRRDPDHPGMRGLGMPVQYWNAALPDTTPPAVAALDLDAAKHNAVFILFDEWFSNDAAWKTFASDIQDALTARGGADRMFAVLFADGLGEKLPKNMSGDQGIPLWDEKSDERKVRKILVRASISLARLLVAANERSTVVNLFLSHAKLDEKVTALAAAFRDYVRASAPFQSFYDAQDLIAGEPWKEQLRDKVRESAVIVFQTDAYSTRPVCHFELLEARYADRPIINVYAVTSGELRVFPYLGNVPSIRYAAENVDPFGPVLEVVTFEVLRAIYTRKLLQDVVASDTTLNGYRVLFRPPDLVACASFDESGFLYPDPPLGTYELELLGKVKPGRTFVTPKTRPFAGGTP